MLSWRLLTRNWRSGELKLLASALMLAVAVVSGIGIFTERLEAALVKESNSFLGADRLVRSSQPIGPQLIEMANKSGIEQAQTIQFASMTFAGDDMHLASVKAVSDSYPLLGKLEVGKQAFVTDGADVEIVDHGPIAGEAWVDGRLLPLLGLNIGDVLAVGEKDLIVSQVIVREPDRGDGFSLFGARVMINIADVDATDVIQPGSRISYNWLLAAEPSQLSSFLAKLEPQLNEHQKLVDLESAQRGLFRTLTTGRQFLSLAATIAVLLAGLAIAIAAQQFSRRHTDQVALMKSLGAGAWRIRLLYFQQLLILAVLASIVGLVAGELLQRLISYVVVSVYPVEMPGASIWPYLLGAVTGIVCLLCFALPALWHLPTIPPMKILRRDLVLTTVSKLWQGLLGVVAVFVLVGLYSQDLRLTATVIIGFFCILAVAGVLALGLLSIGRQLGSRSGSSARLAWASLLRHRGQTVAQVLVFSTALMLLFVITIVRTSLIDEWRFKLPEDAPNHFLVNIAPNEVEYVSDLLAQQELKSESLFPMVRGRLLTINGELPSAEQKNKFGVLSRESNLSWSTDLPPDNEVVDGDWWPKVTMEPDQVYVSVEQSVMDGLQLKLGDSLGFSLGGLKLDAKISSVRTLNWDAMRPNFYFLFSPGALDQYAPTYMTSTYIPAGKKSMLNTLLQHSPTILVVELDLIIKQIQTLTAQVSQGVELVLLLVLAAGIMVLLAAVNASMDYRLQEAGILRALGCSKRRILGSTFLEFFILGALAGVLAVFGAEVLLLGLQYWVLDTPLQAHPIIWAIGPVLGGFLVAMLGVWASRRVVTAPPMLVLREL